MKIILIGFMGSGKTEVGSMLARKLGLNYIEMDFLVIQKSGEKSINQIFEKHGEPTFRELEKAVGEELRDETNCVIATGGGVVLNKNILDNLRQNDGKIIYLRTPFETLEKRLVEDTTRPLFKDKEKAKQLYDVRKPLYKSFADITIDTENKSQENIADEITATLKNI